MLLSHTPVGCSTIAVPGLSFRVRNGTGRLTWAMAAANLLLYGQTLGSAGLWRPGETGQRTRICRCFVLWPDNAHCRLVPFAGGRCGPTARGWNVGVAFRPLVPVGSTLAGFHVRPIDHVFCMGTTGTRRFHGMLILEQASRRCFQRLSLPNVANRPCHWRDNRHTRGSSTQVLSYYGQASSAFQRAQRIETKLSHDVLNPARVPL